MSSRRSSRSIRMAVVALTAVAAIVSIWLGSGPADAQGLGLSLTGATPLG